MAEWFIPYFEKIDPRNKLVDLHTLSPEQILPKHTSPRMACVVGIKVPKFPNPEYNRWKRRLTHHVGAIETYDPQKFKGKFHLIMSLLGGTYYNNYPREVLLKTAALLQRGGRSFLHTRGGVKPNDLQKKLGDAYQVQTTDRDKKYFVITRLK